jgi:hypothetical protein
MPTHMAALTDPPIRSALRSHLQCSLGAGDRIVFEMPVCGGEARLDAARINGRLDGFEIKSDRDTFARLTRQIAAYNRVVEHMTLVCTERHLPTAKQAVPEWWGIVVARREGGKLSLDDERRPEPNPHREPIWVAQLLWRRECLAVLRGVGEFGLERQPRRVLWKRLAEAMELDQLTAEVTAALKGRDGWLAVE